jgi:hypothetical protein
MLVIPSENSYNIFRPNLERDEDEDEDSVLSSENFSTTDHEESKTSSQ